MARAPTTSDAFNAVAEPRRRQILDLLIRGERPVNDMVASLGLALNDVNQSLDIYLGSLYVNSFNQFGRHWQVNLQADDSFRDRVAKMHLIEIRNNAGQMVSLGALADIREVGGPVGITRYNMYTAAPVNGSVPPDFSTGDTIQLIDRLAEKTLPQAMRTEWTELMFLQIRAGNTAFYIFLLRW